MNKKIYEKMAFCTRPVSLVAIAAICMFGGGVAASLHTDKAKAGNTSAQEVIPDTPTPQKEAEQGEAAQISGQSATESSSAGGVKQPATTQTPTQQRPTPPAKGALSLSQSSFTVRPGQVIRPAFVAKTSDGASVTSPGKASGPAFIHTVSDTKGSRDNRTEWSVGISVDNGAQPGTYEVLLRATSDKKPYETTIVVTVQPPSFEIAVFYETDSTDYTTIYADVTAQAGHDGHFSATLSGLPPELGCELSTGFDIIWSCADHEGKYTGSYPVTIAVTDGRITRTASLVVELF